MDRLESDGRQIPRADRRQARFQRGLVVGTRAASLPDALDASLSQDGGTAHVEEAVFEGSAADIGNQDA